MLSNSARRFFDICLNFNRQDCVLCGSDCGQALLCDACRSDLPPAPAPACPVCASAVGFESNGQACGSCLRHPPAFDHAIAALRYAFPADELIQALKYRNQLALAHLFAELLSQTAPQTGTLDLMIPMPLHPQRTRERGFNQALEIARPLAKSLGVPIDQSSLARTRDTTPQATLPLEQRRKNMRGAFTCAGSLTGKHVVLVDDVMTSGATLNEAARTLKRAGASEVSVWVVARAQPQH